MTANNIFGKYQKWAPFIFLVGGLCVYAQMQPRFEVKNVSVDQASALVNSGAVVVDVRGQSAYEERHIPGAINLPLEVLRAGIPIVLASSKAMPVVVYCGDGVRVGPEGTALLNKAGFSKAVNLEKGIQGWAAAGMTVATLPSKP